MFEAFDKNLTSYVSLTAQELELVHQAFQHKTFKKKTLLLSKGQVCNFEAYLIKGCVKRYCTDTIGDEIVLQFAIEDWWMSDIVSFTEQTPSLLYIETIEDTELLQINFQNKEQLFKQVPKLERVFRLLMQRSYSVLENRFFYRHCSFCRRTLPQLYQKISGFAAARAAISNCFLSGHHAGSFKPDQSFIISEEIIFS